MKARPFIHGYEIYLEKATLVFDGTPLTVLHADGRTERPDFQAGELTAFTQEIDAAAEGVATGKEPDLLSGQLARDALVLCHKECESIRTGAAVAVA